MKRSYSDIAEGEGSEPNKRAKVMDSTGDAIQWFEVDDLFGLFVKLIFPDLKLILNLAATNKAYWRQLHSKTAWQGAGYSLHYASSQLTKSELGALLLRKQFPLDASKIVVDVASSDRNKNIEAVCHLRRVLETDMHGVVVDPIAKSLATVTILPRILEFIDMHDSPKLQIASIEVLELDPDPKLVEKLVKLVTTSKSPEVKYSALCGLSNQLSLQTALSNLSSSRKPPLKGITSKILKYEELLHTIINTITLDGVVEKMRLICLHVLSLIDFKTCTDNILEQAIPPVVKIITSSSSNDLVATACNALSSIVQERVIERVKPVLSKIVELLLVNNNSVQMASLKLLDTICLAGSAAIDQELLTNPNLITACKSLIISPTAGLRARTQQLLANVATNPICIQLLMDSELMPLILKPNASLDVADIGLASIIVNMISDGEVLQQKKLLELGASKHFSLLFRLGQHPQLRMVLLMDALKSIKKLFKSGKDHGFFMEVIQILESGDCIQFLEELQTHDSNEVYRAAFEILEQLDQIEDDQQ